MGADRIVSSYMYDHFEELDGMEYVYASKRSGSLELCFEVDDDNVDEYDGRRHAEQAIAAFREAHPELADIELTIDVEVGY